MKVWVYESRRGEIVIFSEDHRHLARAEQDDDNGCSVENFMTHPELYGEGEINGNPDEGDFSIDDGGSIILMEVQ
jgi:hypothetical protein